MTIGTRHRAYLKSLAHPLLPLVRIGKAGVSEQVVEETKKSIDSHELIKVRIEAEGGEERGRLARSLAELAGAELVSSIGKVAVLYRARSENPTIKLPEQSAKK